MLLVDALAARWIIDLLARCSVVADMTHRSVNHNNHEAVYRAERDGVAESRVANSVGLPNQVREAMHHYHYHISAWLPNRGKGNPNSRIEYRVS